MEDPAARSSFKKNGYATFRGRLSSERVKALRSEVERLCEAGWPGCPRGDVFFQDVSNPLSLKQVQQVHRQSELFAAVAEDVCRPIAKSLFASGRAMLVNAQFFNKPPAGLSAATPWHQDGFYFHITPKSGALTFWVALDLADKDNGGLVYAKVFFRGFSGVLFSLFGAAVWPVHSELCDSTRSAEDVSTSLS